MNKRLDKKVDGVFKKYNILQDQASRKNIVLQQLEKYNNQQMIQNRFFQGISMVI